MRGRGSGKNRNLWKRTDADVTEMEEKYRRMEEYNSMKVIMCLLINYKRLILLLSQWFSGKIIARVFHCLLDFSCRLYLYFLQKGAE